jgi:hypothetical protein
VILCEPDAEAGTVKVALHAPWPLAVMPATTGAPSQATVIPVSAGPNPDPVTVTELPGAPLLRLREMPAVTIKVSALMLPDGVVDP